MEGREATPVGKFWDLIQQHIDAQAYPPSERQLARRLGVTSSTLANWRQPKSLVAHKHVVAVAELAGVRYTTALDALLVDIGYLTEDGGQPPPTDDAGRPDRQQGGRSEAS